MKCQSCLGCLEVRCSLCIGVELKATSEVEYALTFSSSLSSTLQKKDITLLIGAEPVDFTIEAEAENILVTTEAKATSSTEVTVKFVDPSLHSDARGLSLKVSQVSTSSYSETTAVSSKVVYQAGAQGAAGAVVLISLLKMDFSVTWLLMNSMQLIAFTSLGMPFIPEDLKVFLGSMDSSSALPSLFDYIRIDSDHSKPPKNVRDYGYKTSDFITNAGNMHTTVLLLISVWITLNILSRFERLQPKVLKILKEFRYNIWLRIFVQSYLKVLMAVLIQLIYGSPSFQYYAAMVAIIFLALLPLVFAYLICTSKNRIFIADIGEFASWTILFKELKTNGGIFTLLYYPLFCLRRALSSFGLLMLAEYYVTQCVVQFVINFTFCLYMFICLPFKDSSVSLLSWYGDACLLAVYAVVPVFLLDLSEDQEFSVILTLKAVVFSSIALSLIIQVSGFCGSLKKVCKPKKKLKVLEDAPQSLIFIVQDTRVKVLE